MERLTMVGGAFALLAAALLIVGIHAAAVRGLADAHYTHARLVLAPATEAKRLPEAGELAQARASLREALHFEPTNPLYIEQLARTGEMAATRLDARDPAKRKALLQALAEWREAARMRPGSPYAWTSIAALKLRLDEMDFEFYGALERAARYGRWEPAVQLAIADIGLAGWNLLAQPAKLQALEAIDRALPRQGAEVRRIARVHGTLALVCQEAPGLRPGGTRLCVKN